MGIKFLTWDFSSAWIEILSEKDCAAFWLQLGKASGEFNLIMSIS
jgi:hypothetical protein